MRKYVINANLVRAIEHVDNNAISAVKINGSTREWFGTTVGAGQGCLLSPPPSIMSDALEEHDGTVSIGGRTVTNLRLTDDIVVLAEEKRELEDLVESLDKIAQCIKWR